MRRLLNTFGPVAATSLLTVIAVLCSIGLTAILDTILKGERPFTDLVIGATIPAILAPVFFYFIIRLTVDLQRRESELRIVASEDYLTGIMNRRHLLERAEHLFNLALRYNRTMSLGMIDLDHFKSINDRYGHRAGDTALKYAALLFRRHLRNVDLLGRYGGEEFIVVMPETPSASAFQILERLRAIFKETPIPHDGLILNLTFSAGLATLDGKVGDLYELVEQADRALYGSKRGGRDRTTIYEHVDEAKPIEGPGQTL